MQKGEEMAITRRDFLAGSAVAAGFMGLAGCAGTSQGAGADPLAAPAADKYPIEPDKGDVTAKYASEEVRDSWTRVTNEDGGAVLGVMDTTKIIQVDGYAFKDMDGDGKLSLWEDWRQSTDDRARALADELSSDEALLLMFHGGTEAAGIPGQEPDPEKSEKNALLKAGSRAGVSRLASNIESYASDVAWINEVQQYCEANDPHGIPYLNSTDQYQLFDIPSNVGLASAMDKEVWRKAGMWLGRGWRATGVRCELGPQIDVYSNPLGSRLSGSVCEDPAVNRDFTQAFAAGLQSTWGDDAASEDKGWGSDSVIAMLKHYVGEGCPEGGRNDHYEAGKFNVFPGDNFEAHLIPFLDGGLNLDSSTKQAAAVMPCYGIAFDKDEAYGENVGGGYNRRNLSILRNAGWDGMFCTDWGILDTQTFGVEKLSEPERYAKMVEAGIDQCGGSFEPEVAKDAFKLMEKELGADEALARVRDSARRIVRVMMNVDLFENPYSDSATAKKVLENEAGLAFGLESSEKSIVMLKNSGGTISRGMADGKPRAYIPQRLSDGAFALGIDEEVAKGCFDVVTDVVGDPTGTSFDMMSGMTVTAYQESDCARATAEELVGVKYAIVRVAGPTFNAYGAGMDNPNDTKEYLPISLQYRPYTAKTARDPSLAGEILPDGSMENRTYRGKSVTTANESDLDFVISVREKLPADAKLIVVLDLMNPMVFSEIEPYADAILIGMRFSAEGPSAKAFANIACGKTEPSGLLAFQMPANMDTVETQFEDVPRDMDCYVDADGNTYDFCFGLNWAGVIDDERTKTYKAAPLTKPETEVKADK